MASDPKRVSFRNGSIAVAGDLRLPDGFREDESYAALVLVTPGSSVKEQIGAVYGGKLAEKGFVTLTFDPSYQGESGGEPRDLEDPAARVEDVRCAIDFLMTLPYVDEERVGLLGICAGGGYAVSAALTEHRIKALATVVPVNIGRAFRQADPGPNATERTLHTVGQQRTAEARGGAQRRDPWLPDSPGQATAAGVTDRDVLDAVDYYRTPRGYNRNSTNRRHVRSDALLLGFDAFHLVGELLTQPVQVIVGGRLGTTFSFADGRTLFERASHRKEFVVIDGAGHYDLYDQAAYVDQAVERLQPFFAEYLDAHVEVCDGRRDVQRR